jgi:hypothetical protein
MSASAKPVVLCLAFEGVVTGPSDRRNLSKSSSQHIVPLWKDIVADELNKRNHCEEVRHLAAVDTCAGSAFMPMKNI